MSRRLWAVEVRRRGDYADALVTRGQIRSDRMAKLRSWEVADAIALTKRAADLYDEALLTVAGRQPDVEKRLAGALKTISELARILGGTGNLDSAAQSLRRARDLFPRQREGRITGAASDSTAMVLYHDSPRRESRRSFGRVTVDYLPPVGARVVGVGGGRYVVSVGRGAFSIVWEDGSVSPVDRVSTGLAVASFIGVTEFGVVFRASGGSVWLIRKGRGPVALHDGPSQRALLDQSGGTLVVVDEKGLVFVPIRDVEARWEEQGDVELASRGWVLAADHSGDAGTKLLWALEESGKTHLEIRTGGPRDPAAEERRWRLEGAPQPAKLQVLEWSEKRLVVAGPTRRAVWVVVDAIPEEASGDASSEEAQDLVSEPPELIQVAKQIVGVPNEWGDVRIEHAPGPTHWILIPAAKTATSVGRLSLGANDQVSFEKFELPGPMALSSAAVEIQRTDSGPALHVVVLQKTHPSIVELLEWDAELKQFDSSSVPFPDSQLDRLDSGYHPRLVSVHSAVFDGGRTLWVSQYNPHARALSIADPRTAGSALQVEAKESTTAFLEWWPVEAEPYGLSVGRAAGGDRVTELHWVDLAGGKSRRLQLPMSPMLATSSPQGAASKDPRTIAFWPQRPVDYDDVPIYVLSGSGGEVQLVERRGSLADGFELAAALVARSGVLLFTRNSDGLYVAAENAPENEPTKVWDSDGALPLRVQVSGLNSENSRILVVGTVGSERSIGRLRVLRVDGDVVSTESCGALCSPRGDAGRFRRVIVNNKLAAFGVRVVDDDGADCLVFTREPGQDTGNWLTASVLGAESASLIESQGDWHVWSSPHLESRSTEIRSLFAAEAQASRPPCVVGLPSPGTDPVVEVAEVAGDL